MKLTEEVHLVGSGRFGFEISNDFDCHVFLLDGGSEAALIDCGAGIDVAKILENIRAAGIPPHKITKIILTHGHADHSGGAAQVRAALNAQVYAPWEAAPWLRAGDEHAVCLDLARVAGAYPSDYHLQPSEIDVEVRDGDKIRVGELELRAIETPGHCHGHFSYFMQGYARKSLFGGDLVFFGGTIIHQNIPDFSIRELAESVYKLEGLGINALLCSHLTLPLRNGQKHIDQAIQTFRALGVPKNFV
jgi:glyoxylase-like metal-dependent hydrolase (beta-lactamase superfamily II)